jgi:hypothetical protein
MDKTLRIRSVEIPKFDQYKTYTDTARKNVRDETRMIFSRAVKW